MRALCGFYCIGMRAPADIGYDVHTRPVAKPWSHSESLLIGDNESRAFNFTVPRATKIYSVHAFGFCMLEQVRIGHWSFPHEISNGSLSLWINTEQASALGEGFSVRITVRGIIEHFGVTDNCELEGTEDFCENCLHEPELHRPNSGCLVPDCVCNQYVPPTTIELAPRQLP
jgi:hypothetical protein